MSGDVVRGSYPSSSSATPRSKLDSLSKDELVYFVKKQVENLKLSKAENARLKTENGELTTALKDLEKKLQLFLENQSIAVAENGDKEAADAAAKENEGDGRLQQECDLLKQQASQLEQQNAALQKKLEELEVSSDAINSVETPPDVQKVSRELFEEQAQRLSELEQRNEELQCTVDELRSLLDDTNQQLSIVKEKRNVENVFSLEIADYEKTVEKLQKELKLSKEGYDSLNEELSEARKELESLHEEKTRINLSMNKMKAAVVKFKSELNEKKDLLENGDKESEKLRLEIERINAEREDEKLHLSTAIGKSEGKIRQLEENVSSLNRQIAALRSVKDSLQRQYDDLLQEHNTFKARALYVLEQKKNDDVQHTKDEVETLEGTIRNQKKAIENLVQSQRLAQDELQAERERSLALAVKLQELERQLNSTSEAHKKKLSEQRQQFESRIASEAKLNSDLITQMDASFTEHAREKERLLNELNKEKEASELKIEELKRSFGDERKKLFEIEHLRSTPNVVVVPSRRSQLTSEISSSYFQRPSPVAENFGDSAEETNSERTLEDVIYGDDVTESAADTVDKWGYFRESVNWEEVAATTQKQLENVRELLCESEAANARLMEQTKLLKGEIRRMERNGERTDHVANTEYLKNVILKFIAPEKVDAEREQLIPVLATMLRLSADEVRLLTSVAQVDASEAASTSKPSGWGSYLHRWSGLS